MDLEAVADAIAGRFQNVTATRISGDTETLSATTLVDSVAQKALLVYPPEADLDFELQGFINDHYRFPVRLFRDPLLVESRVRWLYAWATALRPRIQAATTLGGLCKQAQMTDMRLAIDGFRYPNVVGVYAQYDVVELMVDVHLYEQLPIGI